mgnify:FL=1
MQIKIYKCYNINDTDTQQIALCCLLASILTHWIGGFFYINNYREISIISKAERYSS